MWWTKKVEPEPEPKKPVETIKCWVKMPDGKELEFRSTHIQRQDGQLAVMKDGCTVAVFAMGAWLHFYTDYQKGQPQQ